METLNIKEEVRSLIDRMPENFTWDDLISAISLRQNPKSEPIQQAEIIARIDREHDIDQPQNFWEAVQKFRQENNLEEAGIGPEVFEGVRDK
ncbi:hypothetical protein BCD67_10280 [Oscillatoriales cyanobacterium USR001]|nr:hypothetical protein BCD67_10280 [Oscillatoriales cyanobacterium USR001]